jgi:transglutaminase-like putative cysteine protease
MVGLRKYAAVAVVAICVWAAPRAEAGVGFQAVSPDELKMTSEPLAAGAPAIILYRQVDRDDNGKTNHEDRYYRIKILTEEGRKRADVEIPFFKEDEELVHVRARTIRPDGSITNYDGKVFEKDLVRKKGSGVRAKTFTLPDVQVGGIIEYSYTLDYLGEHTSNTRMSFIYNSRWVVSEDLFTRKAQFSLKPFTSDTSPWALRWNWNTLPAGTVPPKEGPDHIVRMEANNIPAFQIEDHMPPEEELRSRIDFIYEQKMRASDQASYWRDLGKKRNADMESFIGKRKAMEDAVAQIVAAGDSPEVKLRKIYDRVQQIRNTSYELRKTDQEEKREKENSPANVEDVWKRGYGNGRQLTWLFLGLARAAGFDAYGCWVSDRREYFFSPVTMEGRKLNSNVALVKLNGKDLYFDPGGAFTPFGLLQWSETAVPGLRLDKDGGTWIRTTLPPSSESRIERTGNLKLSDAGDLEGKLTVTYIGLEAMYHRLELRHADDVACKKHLEDTLKSQIEAATEVELTNKPDWTNSETPLVAEFNLKIPGWVSNAGKRAVIPAAIFTAAEKGMFEHANRVQPIYFDYPHQKSDDVTVELPPGWQVSSLPQAHDQDGRVVRYNLKVEQGPGTLRLTRTLNVDLLLLEAKYYPALRSFFQVVRAGDGEQIVLQPGEIHASN